MVKSLGRSVLLSALVVAMVSSVLAFQSTRAIAAPGDSPIGGQIFVDLDQDGQIGTNEQLPDSDPFYPPAGIAVTVYDADGNSVPGVVTSSASGVSWTADVTSLIGSDFRVEFEIDPADQAAGYTETFLGPDSSSSVTFASAGDTAVSFGVVPPSTCSGAEGYLWTTCFVNGETTSGGPQDVIVGVDYDAFSAPTTISEKTDVGSVWGLAYDQWSGTLYSSAFVKRNSDLGSEGVDGLYWSDGDGANLSSVSLDSLGGPSHGADLTNRNLGDFSNTTDTDFDTFELVGKRGIGDIDLTPDGRTLLVSNIDEAVKSIDVYDVSAVPTGGNPVFVRSISIPNPGCSDGDYFPYAITTIDADSAYVGVTCTAQTSGLASDLEAHIVEIDISGAGAPATVLSIPLDYERGCAIYLSGATECRGGGVEDGDFVAWTDDPADAQQAAQFLVLSQPMFTDIEIDDDGSLVLGFADRFGHQVGYATTGDYGQNVMGGELLHVCNTSGDPENPTYVVEGAAGCPGNFVDSTGGDPGEPGYHSGPNGLTEFYGEESLIWTKGGHLETSNGGLYIRPGSGEVVVSIMDPIQTVSGGLSIFNTTTGANTEDLELYGGLAQNGYLGKSAGIGDVEGCFVPVGLGDFVWLDLDNDGIQDPGELALAGVTITVSGGSLSAPLTVTTDANGQWELTGLDGLLPGEAYTIVVDPSTATNLPAGITAADLFATAQDSSLADDAIDSDIDPGTFTMVSAPLGVGEINHTYDAGFSADIYDLALAKVYTSDTTGAPSDGVVAPGDDVTFTITVTNQGNVDATTFEVTDYLPAGFVLNDAAWTDNGDGTAMIAGGPLAAGATEDIDITMTADGSAGDFVNWAEISNDDGDDIDSTTDADETNDNQPAAPGDPTDDEIDNAPDAGGAPDEDDHDPAPISIASYDLALTKVYTSDTSADGNTSDGIIDAGDDVTFTITVINQGSVDAATFDVTDYFPVGFTLNDAAWTDNGDGTATIAGGPLAAGTSTTLDITLTSTGAPGSYVNWAEISADDGDDGDSTPDADQTNDNQPTGPGAPTDDEIDNASDAGGAPDEDDHDPAEVLIREFYDLALTKVYTSDTTGAATDGVVSPGDDVTFTITVINQGTADAATFDVTDYLPAGFTLNDAAWTDNGDGTATISGGPLAAGATVDIDITLTADGVSDGDYVNWAEISSDDGNDVDSTPNTDPDDDGQPSAPGDPTDDEINNAPDAGGIPDEDDHDPAPISVATFDLALTKVYTSDTTGGATDGVVAPGDDVTFTITVTNQGSVDAATFDVTDYLPAGFTLNDAAWTDNGDGTATISGGPLAAGATEDISITMTAGPAAGDFVNWAEISADDGDDVDSTPDADQADDNQPAAPGDPTDDVIDGTDGDSDDHDPAPVSVAFYDLALTKAYASDTFGDATDGVIEAGADVTFTITVTNQGSIDAATFTVTDYLPSGFVLTAGSPDSDAWTDNGDGTASIDGGPLAAGDSVDISITTTATNPGLGESVNWAEISADDGDDVDSTPDADQTDDVQPAAPGAPTDDVIDGTDGDSDDHDPAGVSVENYDLALTKAFTSDSLGDPTDGLIQNGSDVTFTITVINQGTLDATTFDVTDYVPAGFVLNDAAWTDNGDGTATITGGPLAAGASTDFDITLTADSAADGDHVNWAEISADDGNDVDSTPDADPADDAQPAAPGDPTDDEVNNAPNGDGVADEDDHDPAPISVGTYDLALTKAFTSDSFGSAVDGVIIDGSDVTFTITVTNQGSIDAATFAVTDYLPSGFVLTAGSPDSDAWTDNGDGTATIAGGPLAAGASTDFEITLTADSAADGDHVNWAEISADDGNDVDSTPDADQTDDVQPAAPGDPTDDAIDGTDGDSDDHDPAGVTVANYDLALTKVYTSDTFGDATDGVVEPGSDVTFTITVINQGTLDANTFEVTDYLPSGFVLNDPAWTDNGDGTATIAGGPLAAGTSTAMEITLTALDPSAGDTVNGAELSADDGDDVDSIPDADPADDAQPAAPGDPTDDVVDNTDGDEDDHDIAGLTVVEYDLALTKAFTSDTFGDATDGVIEPGSDVTFTITVINQGTVDATTFEVTDYVPAGFVLNDAAWTDNGDGTATIAGGPLAAGASTDFDITLTADSPAEGDHVNWAEISADDGNDIDSTADVVPANDVQPAAPGDPTDDSVDGTDGDEDDHDPAGVSVVNYDLAIAKEYTSDTSADGNATDGVIQPGDDATFTITVTNEGTIDAAAVSITDYLPAGFVLNDAAWTDNGDGTATTSVGAIPAGDATSVTITITAVDTGAGPLINVVEISDDDGIDVDSTPDTDPDNEGGPGGEDDIDDAPLTVDAYDLALTKVFTSDTSVDGNATDGVIAVGDDITFTITVFNQGTVEAERVEVTDYLPAGFVLNSSSPDSAAWIDNGDGTATAGLGGIPAGESMAVTITLTAVNPTLGDMINAAEISGDDGNDIDSTPNADVTDDGPITDDETGNANGDEDDHDPATFTVVDEVVPVFDLALRKTLADGSNTTAVSIGDTVIWTVTVFNQGEVNAANIDVIDYIPSGLQLDDSDWVETTAGDATITIPGPIAPGASVSVDITTTVVDGSDLTNLAEIAAADPVDENGVVMVLSDGTVVPDVDSVADALNAEVPVDDEINNTGGDEDDHDIAAVTLVAATTTTTPAAPLAVTGTTWTSVFLYWALGLFFLGAALVLFARKPEDELIAAVNDRRSNNK